MQSNNALLCDAHLSDELMNNFTLLVAHEWPISVAVLSKT